MSADERKTAVSSCWLKGVCRLRAPSSSAARSTTVKRWNVFAAAARVTKYRALGGVSRHGARCFRRWRRTALVVMQELQTSRHATVAVELCMRVLCATPFQMERVFQCFFALAFITSACLWHAVAPSLSNLRRRVRFWRPFTAPYSTEICTAKNTLVPRFRFVVAPIFRYITRVILDQVHVRTFEFSDE